MILVRSESKERRVPPAIQVYEGHREYQENEAFPVYADNLVVKVHKALPELMALTVLAVIVLHLDCRPDTSS